MAATLGPLTCRVERDYEKDLTRVEIVKGKQVIGSVLLRPHTFEHAEAYGRLWAESVELADLVRAFVTPYPVQDHQVITCEQPGRW